MSRPRSLAMIAALTDVGTGMTAYKAAALHHVSASAISRALVSDRRRCKCCGQVIAKNQLTAM